MTRKGILTAFFATALCLVRPGPIRAVCNACASDVVCNGCVTNTDIADGTISPTAFSTMRWRAKKPGHFSINVKTMPPRPSMPVAKPSMSFVTKADLRFIWQRSARRSLEWTVPDPR